MEIKMYKNKPEMFSGDLIVYMINHCKKKELYKLKNRAFGSVLVKAFEYNDFEGKEGQVFSFYPDTYSSGKNANKVKRVLFCGLGDEALTRESFRECGGNIAKYLMKISSKKVLIVLPEDVDFSQRIIGQSLTEGIMLGTYTFKKHKSKSDDETGGRPAEIHFASSNPNSVHKAIKLGEITAEAACAARDMSNEPGNHWTADHFADYSLKIAKKYGLKRNLYGIKQLNNLKMGGILGVNQGSSTPPRLVVLQYRTGKKVPTLMLVGKGLTFDSGGISLKAGSGMEDMKYDMCGGAAVISTMEAVGKLKPNNIDVVAIVPATDNMPGPNALKPGDVIRHYNGKRVEIISTDAEGRLILADALSYGIKRFKPDAVIDVATLTGAVIVGLGHHRTGIMSNDDELVGKIDKAGELCGEPLWRLPLGKEYSKELKSNVADLKNLGGKGGGTITAAAFLQEFVGDTSWAHLDIAGTAWNFTQKSYIPKGPSGTAVRTLIEVIQNWK